MGLDLSAQIAQELSRWSEEIEDQVDQFAEEVATETVQELRATSPRSPKGGKYAKSWRKKKLAKGQYVVHVAAPHYRLTHLLEKSHVLVNGGRSRPIVHIKPAEEKAIASFEEKMERLGK